MPASIVRTGTVGNNFLDGTTKPFDLYGLAGDDTYLIDSADDQAFENNGEGIDLVLASVSYSLTENVENLTLLGASNLDGTGNALDNIINGNDGNNHLDGGLGADSLSGGLGNDIYVLDTIADVVTEEIGSGQDKVFAGFTYTLGANVEQLQLTGSDNIDGTGNDLDNVLFGNSGDNYLSGGAGSDVLFGGYLEDLGTLMFDTGHDTLAGGTGDDIYLVTRSDTVIVETFDGGAFDVVYALYSYVLPTNVEAAQLFPGGIVDPDNPGNWNLTGNAAANILAGNDGNNVLNGLGGDDTLYGSAGDDTYYVNSADDRVEEYANEGTDNVVARVNWTLGNNLENLTLSGIGNTSGTGNGLDNLIRGNAGNNILDGAAGNDALRGGLGVDIMYGGTGDDTYFVDDAADQTIEDKTTGTDDGGTDTVFTSVNYTLDAFIENLTISGSDNVHATGNALNNAIRGNDGNNVLDGGEGADTMTGGMGNDTYYVDNIGDRTQEKADSGTDLVNASISLVLHAKIENLTLTGSADINGTGNLLDNVITGNSGGNVLAGLGGNDTVWGADGNDTLTGDDGNDSLLGDGGDDWMDGGNGHDTYVVDSAGDVVTESGDGTDDVHASVSFTLGSQLENLYLTGDSNIDGTGNDLNNTIVGNSGDNVLSGGAGSDVLVAYAGDLSGHDTLVGGLADDSYVIGTSDTVIVEAAGEGFDVVISLCSYTLADNVEFAQLLFAFPSLPDGGNWSLTGNASGNLLIANDGNNVLNGTGGGDTLWGGAGDDTYYVDSAGDQVNEEGDLGDPAFFSIGSGGTDKVVSSVSWTLGAGFENLTLTGRSDWTGTGNALDNTLHGNSGNNLLTGLEGNDYLIGGTGADTLVGGTGNDVYSIDNTNDAIIELADEGTDSVRASISYSLTDTLENLRLTGTTGIDATGNGLANVLRGNEGANILRGMGGADRLAGGGGADTFVFEAPASNGVDRITDFASGVDHLAFTATDFGFASDHVLTDSELTIGRFAVGSGPQFVFNAGNHTLYWDADGAGGDDAVALAVFSGVTALQASDFLFQ